jgi:hypothetical protein
MTGCKQRTNLHGLSALGIDDGHFDAAVIMPHDVLRIK